MKELPFTILKVDSRDEIPSALEAMIKDIENRVIPAQNNGKPWDYIRLEIEPHNGRFIAYPAIIGWHMECDQTIEN